MDQTIVEFYRQLPGRLVANEATHWGGPVFSLSGGDYYTSNFADIHIFEYPILMGRYQGMSEFGNNNNVDIDAMNQHHVTYSFKVRVNLLDYFMNSAAGCSYVQGISSPMNQQWLSIFKYEAVIPLGFVHFGSRLTYSCLCTATVSLSCTFSLEFVKDDSSLAHFTAFVLSRIQLTS